MALRAGYHGFKKLLPGLKLFRPGCLGIDNAELSKIFFPRSEQAVTGAVNILQNKGVGKEQNGLVFTFPGDGTVVVNGTATATTGCSINVATIVKKGWKIVGCPSGGGADTFEIQVYKSVSPYTSYAVDRGNGDIISTDDTASVNIVIRNGYHADNLIIKPMITPDLNATYADFVPWAMTNRELTDRLVKDAIHQTVTEKGLGFNFMRKDNVVLVEFVGEATEAIANNAKIIDIPSDYTMAINEHAFTLYKNNISGGSIGIITIKADGIYANTAIAIGDKPRGSFTFAYAAGPNFTRSLPEATREAAPETTEPAEEPVKKTTRKKSTAKADTEKEGDK